MRLTFIGSARGPFGGLTDIAARSVRRAACYSSVMPRLTVDLDVLRHALLDHSLSQIGDAPLHVKLSSPASIGRLSIAPDAAVSALVFNRPDDRDDQGVFSADPRAHIPYDQESAWVKTTLQAKASGKAGWGVAASSAGGQLRLSDYRLHAATDGAVRAIRRNLASFRSISRLDDVRKLKPGEALALDLDGNLSISLRLSWSDVIADRLYAILGSVGVRGPVVVKVRHGAEAAATVRLQDQFSVVISRDAQGRFRFAVRKSTSRDHAMKFDVSLGADASGVPVIEAALEPLFEAITGEALRKIEAIAPRLGVDRLTNEERDLIGRIAARLGLENEHERARAVREGVEKLKRDLRRELEKALRWKAATGFAYEYARIDEDSAIADYVLLDSTLLPAEHARALAGDLAHLASTLRGEENLRSVVRYLNESTVSSSSSSGFSLGIGKWIDVRTRDENAFRQTTRTSLDGFRLITFRGTRKYDEKHVPQNDFEWTVDFKAQMPEYLEHPSTRDFDYGLHYSVTLERTALGATDLERMLDFAAMWDVRVAGPAAFAAAIGQKAVIRLQLLFDRDDLESLLPVLPEEEWATALAAAMPWMSNFPERRTFPSRERVYADAWREWLAGASHPNSRWAAMVNAHVESGLRMLEERALPGSFVWTAGDGHPHLREHVRSFCHGLHRLGALMQTDQKPAAIADVWNALHPLWSQRLYIAASGNYLLERARARGIEVQRSLQVELAETTLLV